MIFVLSTDGALVVMLAEKDVFSMRQGRTQFVDQRQLKGATFDRVILSLHRDDQAALEVIRRAGHGDKLGDLAPPQPTPEEARCKQCAMIVQPYMIHEGMCIVCWSSEAKSRGYHP